MVLIDSKDLAYLKKSLPRGSARLIQERAEKKFGVLFTLNYIHKILNPNYKNYNEEIISVAIELRDELLKEKRRLSQHIRKPDIS